MGYTGLCQTFLGGLGHGMAQDQFEFLCQKIFLCQEKYSFVGYLVVYESGVNVTVHQVNQIK